MSTSRHHRMVAFGELLLRLDTPGDERFVQADSFVARYTGGEANVAAALAQWGVDTRAVSKVPDHEVGQACINYMRRFGINTDWVIRGPGRLGILYVEAGASQRPAKVENQRLDANRARRTLIWTDPKSGFEVRWVAVEYDDFPAIEWTVWFKNTGTKR